MLFSVLEKQAKKFPTNVALSYDGRHLSYKQLLRSVQKCTVGMLDLGIRPGDCVAVLSENRPEFIACFFSLAKIGVQFVPINTAYHEKEIVSILETCSVKWLVFDSNHETVAENIQDQVTGVRIVALESSTSGYKSIYDVSQLNQEQVDARFGELPKSKNTGDFLVLFSSGSTGRPKRMIRTQASYHFEMQAFLKMTKTSVKDSILCSIPLYHSHGIGSCILPAVGAGAKLVLLEPEAVKSDKSAKDILLHKLDRLFQLITDEKVTVFPAIPYIFQAILDYGELRREHFANVRYCFSSGNFLAVDLYQAFLERFGISIKQVYGCSEAGAVCIDSPNSRLLKHSTTLPVGKPLPGIEFKVVDDSGKECPADTIGNVVFKSPGLTAGYVDHGDLNQSAFKDGYFQSGDLGRISKQGVVTLTGRKKLLIDTGGKKVDPFEIEDVVMQLPGVTEVVALGVPVTNSNEWIKVVVVANSLRDKQTVIQHCRENLANYKVPKIVEFRDAIPKTATGKLLRKDLVGERDVSEATLEFLLDIISQSISTDTDLDGSQTFEELGIDSITMSELNKLLEKHFSFLPKTLFFEYRTPKALSEYLSQNHVVQTKQAFAKLSSNESDESVSNANVQRLDKKQESSKDYSPLYGNDIAIVGVSGIYPQAKDIHQFWENIRNGKDCTSEIPDDRWSWRQSFDPDNSKLGSYYSKWGGFIDGVYEFDSKFFAIPPVEAETIDPQERLFLGCVWNTLQDAGYPLEYFSQNNRRDVGVFVGVMWGDYQLFSISRPLRMEADGNLTKSNYWALPNRVSYFFDFTGPSIAVDTACSSSLSAIHLACQAINNGECSSAIAGGVNLILHPRRFQLLSLGQYASTDGKCRSFGDGGDGYVPAEGVGSVYLKPLSRAIKDRDHIYGVIKGSAINHGGNTKAFTVPDPNAQSDVIKKALLHAGVEPGNIDYIEAHGTGTELGDPIEIRGISLAFEQAESISPGDSLTECAIGSVKSNIGHCEAAAGIAGLSKILLQFKYQELAPSLHCSTENRNIDFSSTTLKLVKKLTPWAVGKAKPRLAALSSFGAGGSNGHLIVEEYPQHSVVAKSPEQQLYIFSAPSEKLLREYAENWVDYIGDSSSDSEFLQDKRIGSLANIAYTLQTGRTHMRNRLAIVAESVGELKTKLQAYTSNTSPDHYFVGANKGVSNSNGGKLNVGTDELSVIAKQWVTGGVFDWIALQPELHAQKVSLPPCPMERVKIRVPCLEDLNTSISVAVEKTNGNQNKFMATEGWRVEELKNSKSEEQGLFVIVGTHKTKKIAERIFKQNSNVQKIYLEHQESGSGSGFNFYDQFSAERCFSDVLTPDTKTVVSGYIDLTALDIEYEKSANYEEGKIRFLQLLLENCRTNGLKVVQVTYKLFNPGSGGATTLRGARTAGLYKMLGSEYASVHSLVLDTDYSANYSGELARRLEAELALTSKNTNKVSYRKNTRYVQIIKPDLIVDETSSSSSLVSTLSEEDVVLITGGSSGLGLEVAKHIVSQTKTNLIIMGRTVLPDESEWSVICDKRNHPDYAKVLQLQSLRTTCCSFKYVTADLGDHGKLQKLLSEIQSEIGAISCVIHCAGVANNSPVFFTKSIAEIKKVCEPKIQGLNNLYEVLKRNKLKRFVLFSSISALSGKLAAGQSDYAMANTFMDCFALSQKSKGNNYFQSIQWSAWGETGMSASEEAKSKIYSDLELTYLSTKDGLKLFDQATSRKDTVLCPIISTGDEFQIDNLIGMEDLNKSPNRKSSQVSVDLGDSELSTTLNHVNSQSSRSENRDYNNEKARQDANQWLSKLFSRELKIPIDEVEADTLFSDYGIESVLLAQLTQTIQKEFGETLSPSLLLENSNIAELAQYFAQSFPDKFGTSNLTSESKEKTENIAISNSSFCAISVEDDLAVIGISCRFPGAKDKEQYWRNLSNGVSSIKPVSLERWQSKTGRRDFAGCIDDIDLFDSAYFKINNKDAEVMDPQARVLLEESLSVIYDAGYEQRDLNGENVGVYIGARANSAENYSSVLAAPNPILGIGQNYLATNISRFYNLNGPSMVIDTACSSGITALQLASDALLQGRVDMAMVGAASILADSKAHDMFAARDILSESGQFEIFDDNSSGEVLGEGVGLVMLKRASDAVKDGNKIYGLVKAIAINNDGRTLGPGSPNIKAQKSVMQTALQKAGKSVEDVDYIEVNGGGSKVVDSVEIAALSNVYRLSDRTLESCYIGCVKPNIGHLLLSSGIAGFIRCVLSVHKKEVPPYLSTTTPFEFFDFNNSRIVMNRESTPVVTNGKPMLVAQNCFPDGGTNCHVLVEEFVAGEEYICKYESKSVPALKRQRIGSSRQKIAQTSNHIPKQISNIWGSYEEIV